MKNLSYIAAAFVLLTSTSAMAGNQWVPAGPLNNFKATIVAFNGKNSNVFMCRATSKGNQYIGYVSRDWKKCVYPGAKFTKKFEILIGPGRAVLLSKNRRGFKAGKVDRKDVVGCVFRAKGGDVLGVVKNQVCEGVDRRHGTQKTFLVVGSSQSAASPFTWATSKRALKTRSKPVMVGGEQVCQTFSSNYVLNGRAVNGKCVVSISNGQQALKMGRLLFGPDTLTWRAYQNSASLNNAVRGGMEGNTHMHVCKASVGKREYAGTVYDKKCVITKGGRTYRVELFGILTKRGKMPASISTLVSSTTTPGIGTTLNAVSTPNSGFVASTWLDKKMTNGKKVKLLAGGYENRKTLYICKGAYQRGVYVGKIIGGRCNIGIGGKEVVLSNYSVLKDMPVVWKTRRGQNAVDGGYDGRVKGRRVYVCRASFKGGSHPGTLSGNQCSIGYGGKQIKLSRYQVLHSTKTAPTTTVNTAPKYRWVQSNGRTVKGAIVGGKEGRRTLPICKARFGRGNQYIGKVVAKKCNVGFGGKEYIVGRYDVLVGGGVYWSSRLSTKSVIGASVLTRPGQRTPTKVYICQARLGKGTHPGTIIKGKCSIGYGGKSISLSRFNVLTAK